MADDTLKKSIDTMLAARREKLVESVAVIKTELLARLEELKTLGEYNIDEFEKYLPPPVEEKIVKGDNHIEVLHEAAVSLNSAVKQTGLIEILIENIQCFSSRAALFLLKDDQLIGWKAKGFRGVQGEITDLGLTKIFFSLSAQTVFRTVLDNKQIYLGPPQSQPDDHLIYNRFGGDPPEQIFVLPFFVKGKPQAVIYTDSFPGTTIFRQEIETLKIMGEMSLDLLPIRQKILSRVQTQEFQDEKPAAEIVSNTPEPVTEVASPSVGSKDPERLARVIINDILLYNTKAVEEGLKNKKLFEILEDTILQAREQFKKKYRDVSIFEKHLVKTLAKGDISALKGYRFESIQ